MTKRHLILLCVLLLVTIANQAADYNGGRCDGSIALYGGDYLRFTPGGNPAPRYLWILVQQGGGNVLIQNSNGDITTSMYLNTFDMLLFEPTSWVDFYFQGGYCQIFYGGTILNPPQNPICNTGSLGPVLLLTSDLRNVAIQSGASGPVGIKVSVYQKMEQLTNGGLSYRLLSNLGDWTVARAAECSGSSCCNPHESTFFIKNLLGGSYTPFLIDSEGMTAFDWTMVPAPPVTCDATATPTSGTVPVTVAFHGTALGGSGGFTYDWNFGDGKTGSGEGVSHTYKSGGTFTWKLTVTDQANKTCQKSGTVTFLSPLTLAASATPRQGVPPLTVAFACEVKGGRSPYTYEWIFGDGGTSQLKTPNHTFTEAGEYEVLATATDADSKSAAVTVPVYCGVPINPTIGNVQKQINPFRLVLTGADFESGCTIYINGTAASVSQYKNPGKVVAKGSNVKALVPKGQRVCISVKNPSGGLSDCFWYTR